jgi:hypothetical protein
VPGGNWYNICFSDRNLPMKARTIIVTLFFLLLIIVSCQKDHTSKIEVTSDYLPLSVGNYWEFELSGKYLVKETQLINGKEYYEINNDYGSSSFYRKQDNKIYVRELSAHGKEEMKFDLAAETNDTWTYGAGYVTLVNRDAIVTIGGNQIDSCLEFRFHNDRLVDFGSEVWLAPGIGFIQQSCQECFGSASATIQIIVANINTKDIEFKYLLPAKRSI